MSDFEYDCLQKKRLAKQAQYKKNGSKSKKCTLPHEYLTNKQLRERNGVMMTYSLAKPMNWKQFKDMPVELQKEYIAKLIERYGVNMIGLLEMFDVNRTTLMRHMQATGMNFTFPKGHRMSKEQKEVWESFRNEGVSEEPTTETDNTGTGGHDETAQAEETYTEAPEQDNSTPVPKMTMEKMCLSFSGNLDTSMISNSLKIILGDGWCGRVEIVCHAACAEV